MNRQCARECLALESAKLQRLSYQELIGFIDRPLSKWVTGTDGEQYQLEINVFWDCRKKENVRVMLAVDDGGWRAFVPLTDSFIVSPTGKLLG